MHREECLTLSCLLVAVIQSSSGCKSDSLAPGGGCAPGETRACVGSTACSGAQTCGDDGNSWSACDCGTGGANAGSSGVGGTNGGSSASGSTTQSNDTGSYVLIDDMEGNETQNGPIELDLSDAKSRPGYWGDWYSTADPLNTMAPTPFTYETLAAAHATFNGITSTHAAHLVCNLADLYGYCEMGLWFIERDNGSSSTPDAGEPAGDVGQRIPTDISKYRGIVFWGMSSLANRVKVQFDDAQTDVFGRNCGQSDASTDQCWDAFSKYESFTNTWQRYEVKFSELTQEGWGYAAPSGKFDPTTAYFLNFEVVGPGSPTAPAVAADFWIDDIYFE